LLTPFAAGILRETERPLSALPAVSTDRVVHNEEPNIESTSDHSNVDRGLGFAGVSRRSGRSFAA
jgi:hypothetical protein